LFFSKSLWNCKHFFKGYIRWYCSRYFHKSVFDATHKGNWWKGLKWSCSHLAFEDIFTSQTFSMHVFLKSFDEKLDTFHIKVSEMMISNFIRSRKTFLITSGEKKQENWSGKENWISTIPRVFQLQVGRAGDGNMWHQGILNPEAFFSRKRFAFFSFL